MSHPPRIHIIGRKNSGKTTLIEELVRELAARGLRVGTIKHTHHHHELDVPGKDSHRHRQAGAAVVGILAPGMHAIFWPTDDFQPKEDRYAAMLSRFEGLAVDLVLVEGDTQTSAPKIEVWRAETRATPLVAEGVQVAALVSDDTPPTITSTRMVRRTQVAELAEYLLTFLASGRSGA